LFSGKEGEVKTDSFVSLKARIEELEKEKTEIGGGK
jgi:hypothetical protein